MNLHKVITNIHGQPSKKSFPANDAEKAQDETVANVVLNSLAMYPVKERKEVFLVSLLAHAILEGRQEYRDEEKELMVEALHESTYRETKDGPKGIYMAHVIAQCLVEVGVIN